MKILITSLLSLTILASGAALSAPKQQYRLVESYLDGSHKVCVYERTGSQRSKDATTQTVRIGKYKTCLKFMYF
jgi:hypothetical protein